MAWSKLRWTSAERSYAQPIERYLLTTREIESKSFGMLVRNLLTWCGNKYTFIYLFFLFLRVLTWTWRRDSSYWRRRRASSASRAPTGTICTPDNRLKILVESPNPKHRKFRPYSVPDPWHFGTDQDQRIHDFDWWIRIKRWKEVKKQ